MRNKERSCYGKIIRCMFYPYGFLSFWSKDYERDAEHIRLLEEGELLYRILESEIRNTRTPLPLLFGELSERTDSLWHNFFLNFLLRYLKI